MRTVSIFKNGNNRAIRLPRDLDFDGVSELEIVREGGQHHSASRPADLGLVRAAGQGRSGLYGGA
ncbi:vagC protein [Klebsiella pneumoniae]|nr:vagC protein [Klebsiella quasipneumoniae]VGH80437.1 vagC protein [Klebsiella pneumoniae]